MNLIVFLLMILVVTTAGIAQDISTGPGLPRSESRSSFMRGMQTDSSIQPVRLRVMGIDESEAGQVTASVIALDAEGNLLPISLDRMPLAAEVSCRGASPQQFSLRMLQAARADEKPASVSLFVMCDNSMLSGTLTRDVALSLQRSLGDLAEGDLVGLGVYNQSFTTILPLGPASDLINAFKIEDVPSADGLSSLYGATQNACRILASAAERRALVIVTSTTDNATPFSTTMDVVRLARDAKIPVFVIRVGLEAAGQPLRYITSTTGGRIYTLEPDETNAVGEIVREILYSQKWSTRIAVMADVQDFVNCETPWLRLRLESESIAIPVIDSISLTPLDISIETSPSIVALFRDTTDNDLRDYYQSLLVISEVLSQNPAMSIELTGHVSTDVGPNSEARAMERARQVRSFLIANGVIASQIVVRSEGSRKPRYYFQNDGTRRLLNNRVEARMLVDGKAHHTVTVEQVADEQTAMLRLKLWKDRKLNAYFEPILEAGETRYRIKLWGFSSLAEAKSVASEIKKYKPSYAIVE
jgi:outer membrane protein OmpA-like peptidoglycan-associated protein